MGARTSRSGKIKVHVASKSTVALYVVLSVLAAITVFALVVMDYGKVSFPGAVRPVRLLLYEAVFRCNQALRASLI